MRTERFLPLFLVALVSLTLLAGCPRPPNGGRPTLTTPPTFVMAWTSDGQPGQVWTVESNDGVVWRNPSPQNLQGNLSESNAGPAIAHDGNLAWMLMWPNPRGLDYKVGIGGVALSGEGGVFWESQPNQGLLPFPALGGRPVGSPALAFGINRWVVVLRTTAGNFMVVRSQPNSATAWEPARDVEVLTPSGVLAEVSSQRDPALAFGQGTFVLIHRGQSNFIASTSPDGVTWTNRGPIAQIPDAEVSDPAITFSNGNFLAAFRKRLSNPPGWVGGYPPSTAEIYKSPDGINWTRIADNAGYFSPIGKEFGPGFSFGDFGKNVCKAILTDRGVQIFPQSIGPAGGIQFWTGTPPAPHTCTDPSLLAFSPNGDAGEEITTRSTGSRTAIAFGRTLP